MPLCVPHPGLDTLESHHETSIFSNGSETPPAVPSHPPVSWHLGKSVAQRGMLAGENKSDFAVIGLSSGVLWGILLYCIWS